MPKLRQIWDISLRRDWKMRYEKKEETGKNFEFIKAQVLHLVLLQIFLWSLQVTSSIGLRVLVCKIVDLSFLKGDVMRMDKVMHCGKMLWGPEKKGVT